MLIASFDSEQLKKFIRNEVKVKNNFKLNLFFTLILFLMNFFNFSLPTITSSKGFR